MTEWLLDTNALIWLLEGSPRMDSARGFFSQPGAKVYISVVSWWEIAIKARSGKLSFSISQLEKFVNQYDFKELVLTRNCIKTYLELPAIHKDPFDHMLLAQAISSPMRLITGDAILAEYSSLVMVV